MGMGGRHHLLPVPKQQLQGAEGAPRGVKETTEVSSTATESDTIGTAAIPIPVPRHVETREAQGELSSLGGQETSLPPGLTIALSSSSPHTPVSLSPEAISMHSTSNSSSHPLVGLTPPPPARRALAMAHLESTLALVRSAVTEATPSTSFTTQVMQPPAEAAHTMSNEWYRAINNDGWYKYKPNQHISGASLHWENLDMPDYATYLKPEIQAGNPMLMGSMGPGQPIYGTDLQVQPYHATEPEHFPEVSFDCISNLLDPHIDRAVTTLGNLGIMVDVFCLQQLPLKYMDCA
jgi:hypothetical protein